jgi:plastocyanin
MARIPASIGVCLLVAGVLAVPYVATGAAAGSTDSNLRTSAGVDHLVVTVGDYYAFNPSTIQVSPGDQVQLEVVQTSASLLHTFTLSDAKNFAFTISNSTSDLLTFFAHHPPLVNISLDHMGDYFANFTAPALGTYQYVCLIPGHFQAGMSGTLGSGVSVSPPNTSGLAALHYLFGGGIAAMVIASAGAGFVFGRKRARELHRERPEYLGQPPAPEPAQTPGEPESLRKRL